jgi:MFS family permease
LVLLAAAQFVVVLDASIVNVALPSIGKDLDFSQDNLSWVVSAYALVFGGFLVLGGRIADLLGRRRSSPACSPPPPAYSGSRKVNADRSFVGDSRFPSLLAAIGLGLAFVSMTVAAVSGVEPREEGLASGLINTSHQIGGALGLAILAPSPTAVPTTPWPPASRPPSR